jgi:hypothetical protein
MVELRVCGSTLEQLAGFAHGFPSFFAKEDLAFIDADDLDRLIYGEQVIDADDLARNCEFGWVYRRDDPVIERFFRVIAKWPEPDLAPLLQLVTGNSPVPLGVFGVSIAGKTAGFDASTGK